MAREGYIGLRIGVDLHKRFAKAVELRDTKMSEVIRQAIIDYCEQIEGKYKEGKQ